MKRRPQSRTRAPVVRSPVDAASPYDGEVVANHDGEWSRPVDRAGGRPIAPFMENGRLVVILSPIVAEYLDPLWNISCQHFKSEEIAL